MGVPKNAEGMTPRSDYNRSLSVNVVAARSGLTSAAATDAAAHGFARNVDIPLPPLRHCQRPSRHLPPPRQVPPVANAWARNRIHRSKFAVGRSGVFRVLQSLAKRGSEGVIGFVLARPRQNPQE